MVGPRRVAVVLVAAVATLAAAPGCRRRDAARGGTDARPALPPEIQAQLDVATAEAERRFGVALLEARARKGEPAARARAIRGLGRVGGPTVVGILAELVGDPEPAVRLAAVEALGLAGEPAGTAALARIPPDALADVPLRAAAIEARGRIGSVADVPTVVAALGDPAPSVRRAAGLALGRLARRKVATGAGVALAALAGDPDPAVRHAVAWSLAQQAGPDASLVPALVTLAADADPETRAQAVRALAAHAPPDEKRFLPYLDDDDWRVRVEAVRALAGERSSGSMRAWLASWLVQEWTSIADLEARLLSPRVHPVLEGLALLGKHGREPYVRREVDRLYHAADVTESTVAARYTPALLRPVGAVHCLAAAARVRAGAPIAEVRSCGDPGGVGFPVHERRRLLAELVAEGHGGTVAERVALLEELWRSPDPRIRAAAGAAAVAIEDPAALAIVEKAFLGREPVIPGSAADAIAERARAGQPIARRAQELLFARHDLGETDLGLQVAFVDALGAVRFAPAAPGLRRLLGHPNATLRERARAALERIEGKDPGAGAPREKPYAPPLSLTPVLGAPRVYRIKTTKGDVTVELDPAVAPWNVAHLVGLVERDVYDGTIWHRVVPNFVVQGGDPSGSGWGGPGHAIPGEPSTTPFVRGAIGIADAGPDTGSSQFFIAHARAPQLDGRYTLVGRVVEGMDVVDALVVGDALVDVTRER